jgi:Major tropism determinant N-terminal domain
MTTTIKLRRDTAYRWSQFNPILADGEPGFEMDTGLLKIGRGDARWNDLDYIAGYSNGGGIPPTDEELLDHINSALPHPVYDEGPSLVLIYQNAKV